MIKDATFISVGRFEVGVTRVHLQSGITQV